MGLVKLLSLEGETTAACSETAQAVEELSRRPAHAAMAMLFLALPWVREGSLDEQLGWLDRAAGAAARSKDRAVRIAVAGHRAVFLLYVGDPKGWQAVEEIPRPGPAADEVERALRVCGNLADALVHLGYYGRAEEFNQEGLRLLARAGHSQQAVGHRVTELQLRWLVGEWDGLEERARSYLEAWEDWAALRADARAVLGLLLLARSEVPAALRLLEPLSEDFRGEAPVLAWVSGALARIRLAEGRSEAALEEAAHALQFVEQKGVWAWATDVAPVAVEAFLAADRQAEADDLTRRFANGLKGRDAPAASAALMVCRALLAEAAGELELAARRYLAAERAWQALPRPYEAARARESAGSCLLTEGKERGRQLLVGAMDAFRELGAGWDATRVRRTLREHGVIPPHRRGRKSYAAELSPREAQVAELAREGLSNRDIALTLYLSRKTVEGHLTSIMRKLGVTSRTELSGRLGNSAAVIRPRPGARVASQRSGGSGVHAVDSPGFHAID
jgi:DNA-binding CsgD family transcriptional regulator